MDAYTIAIFLKIALNGSLNSKSKVSFHTVCFRFENVYHCPCDGL